MRQALRFIFALVAGLALLTWGASLIVSRTTRAWFERDMLLRAELAVSGARETLVSHWAAGQKAELRKALVELTHDERVLGAAACGADLTPLARTVDYPAPLSCERLGPEVRADTDSPPMAWTTWAAGFSVPGGQVHATAIPVVVDDQPLGFVVLVHDLSFVERREATTRRFLALAFGFLAVAASIVTLVAGHLSWRGWSNELRRLIRGERPPPEFRPFLRDVRDLVDRLASEREADGQGGLWTPQRLKNTLGRHLHGERVVLVANREPYIHERTRRRSGDARPPGERPGDRARAGHAGLLGSVGRARQRLGRSRGRRTRTAGCAVPPGEESYVLRRVWLSPEEEKGYYYGFSNEGLWPLCHIAHTRPIFRSEDWQQYQAVNRKFADAVCEEVDSDDPIILVQDYHFALLPRMIRERLPRATVIMFWHIPWPNAEQLRDLPVARRAARGAARQQHPRLPHAVPLQQLPRRASTASSRRASTGSRTRSSTRGSGPWSGPTRSRSSGRAAGCAACPSVPECRRERARRARAARRTRCSAWASIVSTTPRASRSGCWRSSGCSSAFPRYAGRFSFVQLAAPSRTVIPRYRQLDESVEHDRRSDQRALRRRAATGR